MMGLTHAWSLGKKPSENYEAEQAQRLAWFDKIKPAGNWKNPIKKWIEEVDFDQCNQACIWFTGGSLTIAAKRGTRVLVESGGYYVNIGS
jgi:hypothetical protein